MLKREKLVRLNISAPPEQHDAEPIEQGISWPYVFRLVILLAVLLGVGAGIGLAFSSGWLPAQFKLKRIAVRGCYLTDATDLMTELKITQDESYLDLRRKLQSAESGAVRWFDWAQLRPKLWRSALVEVHETQPLVAVNGGGTMYWLCADGQLALQSEADVHPVFEQIRALPEIRLGFDPGTAGLPATDELLTAVACLHASLPGEIERVELDYEGELVLFDRSGFEIRLGEPEELERKIAALPKALRICAQDRSRMLYLDASNPEVFYQKWKEPVT